MPESQQGYSNGREVYGFCFIAQDGDIRNLSIKCGHCDTY